MLSATLKESDDMDMYICIENRINLIIHYFKRVKDSLLCQLVVVVYESNAQHLKDQHISGVASGPVWLIKMKSRDCKRLYV